ncbi:MAG: hypothetical protein J6Y89_07960 [Lachnospiraceae bacterium]|nr:hypothetical protein [Lachnospiraceae bacterium]
MKNKGFGYITAIAVLLMIPVLTLSGCKKDPELTQDVLVQITGEEKPKNTSTPTPSAEPTPIVDKPADRYNAYNQPRSSEDEVPVEIGFTDEIITLNPFYADSALADEIVAKTQAPLFYIGEDKKAAAGVEYPCIAYEYAFIDDTSMFGNAAKEAGDNYRTLRVVLKEGITFYDGEAVSVDDVVYSAYVLANSRYDGPLKFYENDIYGLSDYHTQVSSQRRKNAEIIKNVGINKDGTYPTIDGIKLSEQKEFWDCWDEAGIRFAQDIIDFVCDKYGENAYVQAFLSNKLTWPMVNADDSLKTAYAFAIWGYMKTYNSNSKILTDTYGNTYNLNEVSLTAKDLFNAIFTYYQYDLDDKTGINYECPVPEKHFEDYVEEIYLSKNLGVDSIGGIATGAYRYPDYAMRGCVYFLVGRDVQPEDINFYVVPKHIYLGNERLNDLKGAGEYSIESISETENTITLVANEGYMLGSPKKKYLKYVWKE